MNMSRRRFRYGIFIVSAVGLGAINLIWLIPTMRNARASASLFALTVAERMHSEISTSLQGVLSEELAAAEDIAREPERVNIILQRVLVRYPLFATLALVNNVGKELVRAERGGFALPRDLRDQSKNPALYLALQGTPTLDASQSSPLANPVAIVAVPVRRSGQVDRVLIGEIDLQNLIARIRSSSIGEGHAYVLDRDGFQILHPDFSELLQRKNFILRPIAKKVLIDGAIADGLASEDGYVNELGIATFTVGVPIPIVHWGIFVEQPRTQAFASENQAILLAYGAMLLGAGLLLIIARSSFKREKLARRQDELLQENDQSAKMLVRRDIELTNANMHLQELDRTKSEFVSVVAHELRTPLTGLRWSYSALLGGELGKISLRQKKTLTDCLQATMQMIALISNLLNIARIEEGRFGFTLRSQPLAPLIEKVIAGFMKLATDKGVAVSLTVGDGHFPDLFLDEEKMVIAITNLLDNAIKYTPPGGTITLSLRLDTATVRLEVRDTGIGIPKSQMQRLFSKFFRANNAVLLQTPGNGLGLYVVREIIKRHDGTVTVESEEGKGTVFTVLLPIKKMV